MWHVRTSTNKRKNRHLSNYIPNSIRNPSTLRCCSPSRFNLNPNWHPDVCGFPTKFGHPSSSFVALPKERILGLHRVWVYARFEGFQKLGVVARTVNHIKICFNDLYIWWSFGQTRSVKQISGFFVGIFGDTESKLRWMRMWFCFPLTGREGVAPDKLQKPFTNLNQVDPSPMGVCYVFDICHMVHVWI